MTYATDRLMKNARISLPGSLDGAIQLELFNVLDEFLKDTRLWVEDTTFSVSASDLAGTIYYIEPESVSSIVALTDMKDTSGFRVNAFMSVPGEVTLATPPGQTGEYTATIALTIVDPTQSDGFPEFPEWILEKYRIGILDGLLGRMMAEPAKPYSNLPLAIAHLKRFNQAKAIACTEATHKNVQNMQSWMFPQSFATRSRRR